MTRCWVEFCERQVPNTWQPALVGEPFRPKRRPHCFGSVPIIRCVNRKNKLRCFRQDTTTRRWSSLSPARTRDHLAGASSSQRLDHPVGSQHSWPWFASNQTCRDECLGSMTYRMRVPSGCEKHILDHMRFNCAACMNFACHWRRALKDQLRLPGTDLLPHHRKARRWAPVLNRSSPRQQLSKAKRNSSPERFVASSGLKPSPNVSWWFGNYIPSSDSEVDLSVEEKSAVEKELNADTLTPSFYSEQTLPKTFEPDGFESVAMDGTVRPSRLQETDRRLSCLDAVHRSSSRSPRMAPQTQASSTHWIPSQRTSLVQGIEGEAHDFGNAQVDDLRDMTYHRTPYASDDGPETFLRDKRRCFPENRPRSNSKSQRSPRRKSHLPSNYVVSDFMDKYSTTRDKVYCDTRLSYHDHQIIGDYKRDDSDNCDHRTFSKRQCYRGKNGSSVETFDVPKYPNESSKRMLFSDSPRRRGHINVNPHSHPKEEATCGRVIDTGEVSPRLCAHNGRTDRNHIGQRHLYRVRDIPQHEKIGSYCSQYQGHDVITWSPPRLRDPDQEHISLDSGVLQSHQGRQFAQSPLPKHALFSGQRYKPLPLSSHRSQLDNKTGNFGTSQICPPTSEAINTTCIPRAKLKNNKMPKLNIRHAHADKILTSDSPLDPSLPADHFSRWVTIDPDHMDHLTYHSDQDHELRGGRILTRASSHKKLNHSDDPKNKTNQANIGSSKDLTDISETCRVRRGHGRPSCTAAFRSSRVKYEDFCDNRKKNKQAISLLPDGISTCRQGAIISPTRQQVSPSQPQLLKSSLQAPVDRQDHHKRQSGFLQSPTHESRQTVSSISPTDRRGQQPHLPGREIVRGSHQQIFNSSQNSTHLKSLRHGKHCRPRPSRRDGYKDENSSNSSTSASAKNAIVDTDTPPFGPSNRVLGEARPDSQPEWAAKHVSLMTECSQQQQKVAKSRMVRIVNKTQDLSRTSRQMRLNFGDLDQRLDKVYELQQTYFGHVDEAIRRLQQRDPSLDQSRPTLQRCQDALGKSARATSQNTLP